MSVNFERAQLTDAPALVKVAVQAFHHDSVLYPQIAVGGPPGYDSVAFMRQKIREDICYKITDDDVIVGGIMIFKKSDEHYHLDLIFIAPAHHDRGIGTQAMHFIEAHLPATRWTLDTPIWAIRNIHFYEKLDYVKVGKIEQDDITLIMYEKHLTN